MTCEAFRSECAFHPMGRDAERGFSLVELAVVLVVFGLLYTMSLPAIRRYTADASLLSGAEQVSSHVRLARFKSISVHSNVIMRFQWAAGTYTLHTDTNGNGLADNGEPVRGPFALPQRITFANSSYQPIAGDSLVFRPDGTLAAGGACVLRSPANNTKTLTVMRSTGDVWSR